MRGKAVGLPAYCKGIFLVEMAVTAFFCLSTINLAIVLVSAGSWTHVGPIPLAELHLVQPLLIFLLAGMALVWLRARRRGVPFAKRWRSPVLLVLGVVFIYSLNGRALTAGDTIPASYLPLSLWREFDFDLDEFPFLYEAEMPWFLQRINGRVVSAYPPWAGVLAAPVYLLPVLGGLSSQSPWIHDLEKLSATLITALSVLLLLFTLRRLTSEKIAWYIAIVYAFGTSSFSSSSQALWQHGPSQLFLTLTLYWLVKGIDTPRFSAYAGFALATAIICRPSNAFMAIPVVVYVFLKRRDQFGGFCLASLPPLLWFMAYNMFYNGSPVSTGFAVGMIDPARLWNIGSHLFQTPLYEGLAGILGSPGRGLFIYSPILLVSVAGMTMVWRDPRQVLLKYLSLAPLPIILLTAKWVNWWGGGSYGPRLLADIVPILCLYLYPPLERVQSRPFLRSLIVCLAVLSISLHALRVFGGGDWNGHPNVDWHQERLWSWRHSPPLYYGHNMIMQAAAKAQQLVGHLPTSRNAPEELAASYRLLSLTPGTSLPPNTFLICRVQVVNKGEAVWLARTRWEKGEVRLRWRWFRDAQEVPLGLGGWLLGYDILPGQNYTFTLEIATPREPGQYMLELGLVSMDVTSFTDRGVAPLEIPIHVAGQLHAR